MDSLIRPISLLSSELPPGFIVPEHSHPWGQLVYASQGLIEVITQQARHLVPPEKAVWVPGRQLHAISSARGAWLDTVFLDDAEASELPAQVCVLEIKPLLRELIAEAARRTSDYSWEGPEGRLLRTLRDQITIANEVPLYLPMPRDARLHKVCEGLQKRPDDNRSLEEWGLLAGASSRTLARLFRQETGMKFSVWRQQLRIHLALNRLSGRDSVTEISHELGYESASAFISVFQSHLGMTPGEYRRSIKV